MTTTLLERGLARREWSPHQLSLSQIDLRGARAPVCCAMPELAEVEWYRRQWDGGLGKAVTRVALHPAKRIFRGAATGELKRRLTGARLLRSEARGKRMLFRFSNDNWLGIHLGMSGKLQLAAASYRPGKHDHFVIFQNGRALVFRDARQFGRVQFHHAKEPPGWWSETVPEIGSTKFNRRYFDSFLQRHFESAD